ncbi:MAG: class GN sortase [Xanthomonadales bacterium]|nr:class GN sortase [Xanthomonadales bacterium]
MITQATNRQPATQPVAAAIAGTAPTPSSSSTPAAGSAPAAPHTAPARTSTGRLRQPRHLAAALLALAAAALALDAGWVHAKASLAQHLLDRAWQRTLAEGGTHRPWPRADTRPVARLHRDHGAASGNARTQTILAGDNGRSLAFGPGWAEASAAAGQPGTTVISGHRDTHFAWLQHAAAGDTLSLEDASGHHTRYQVTGTTVVDSRHQRIALHEDGDTLLLVTCWPFNAVAAGGPLRYVVSASAVRD